MIDSAARVCTAGSGALAPEQDGYVRELTDNLVPGVTPELFTADFAGAAGHELDGKMRAAYSSSALAVNSFAPWKKAQADLA